MMLGKMTCSRPPARRPKFRPLESHGSPHSFLSYLTASLGRFCSCLGWLLPWSLQGFFPVFQNWAAITQAGGFGAQLPIHPKKKKKKKHQAELFKANSSLLSCRSSVLLELWLYKVLGVTVPCLQTICSALVHCGRYESCSHPLQGTSTALWADCSTFASGALYLIHNMIPAQHDLTQRKPTTNIHFIEEWTFGPGDIATNPKPEKGKKKKIGLMKMTKRWGKCLW